MKMRGIEIGKRLAPLLFRRHQRALKAIISNIESFRGDFSLDKLYRMIESGLNRLKVGFFVVIINDRRDAMICRYHSGQKKGGITAPGLGTAKLPLDPASPLGRAVISGQPVYCALFPGQFGVNCSAAKKSKTPAVISPLMIRGEAIGAICYLSRELAESKLPAYHRFSQSLTRLLSNMILYEEKRRSEEKYRMLVDNARDGVAIVNHRGEITFANNGLCGIAGLSHAELDQARFIELVDPADRAAVSARLEEQLSGRGTDASYEFKAANKEIFLSGSGSAISRGGEIVGVQLIIRDITENKKLQNRIKEAKDRYEQIIDTINDGLCVIDRQHRITSCNQAFAEKVGLPFSRILGRECREIIPLYENRLLSGHCVHSVCGKTCGTDHAFRDGKTRIYVEESPGQDGRVHYHYISVFPAKSQGGQVRQVVMTIRNITQSREAEEKIRQLSEFKEHIFDAAPISILALDKEGRVVSANALAKSLIEQEGTNLIGRNLLQTGQISQNPELLARYRRLLAKGRPFLHNDLAYFSRDGSGKRSLNIIAVPLYDKHGAVEGAISMALDNTEAKTAKEKLEELNRSLEQKVASRTKELDGSNRKLSQAIALKSKFIADASHELRTPLTVVQGNLDLALREAANAGCAPSEFYSMILDEVERMARILSDLTILTNMDSGSEKLSCEPVDIGRLIRSVAQSLKVLADQKKIALIYKKGARIVRIFGDEAKLEKLLLNIIRNAIKYSNPKGRIRIWAEAKEAEVWISVEDNGIGIPEEDLPFIFERFYRVDKSRSRDEGGTGLGLSISQWIAGLHHGRIEVESKLGQGSLFRVVLPLDCRQAPAELPAAELST